MNAAEDDRNAGNTRLHRARPLSRIPEVLLFALIFAAVGLLQLFLVLYASSILG